MTFDAIVVGAGPAGSAAATVLAQSRARVLLVEKDTLPRAKVCGELLSAGALSGFERLGVLGRIEELGPERIESGEIFPSRGRGVPFRLAAPALGISRFRLDALLSDRAREAGAQWRSPARVLSIEGGPGTGFRVRVSGPGPEETLGARTVIGAWGRWDALDRGLGRGFLAAAALLRVEPGLPRGRGSSRTRCASTPSPAATAGSRGSREAPFTWPASFRNVGGGAFPPAGRASSTTRGARIRTWTAPSRGLAPDPAGFHGTVPVVFTAKPATERGILLAGDAAGVIDPFSGEGQTAALASGILAGDTAARFLCGELSPDAYLPAYRDSWRRLFHRRFAWSALLRQLVLHPRLGQIAGRIAGERLVRFGVSALHG